MCFMSKVNVLRSEDEMENIPKSNNLESSVFFSFQDQEMHKKIKQI